jgi:hypothetical protein
VIADTGQPYRLTARPHLWRAGPPAGAAPPVARIQGHRDLHRLTGFPDLATRIEDGKVTEIFTLQDQFAMLKQIGYLPDSVHAA